MWTSQRPAVGSSDWLDVLGGKLTWYRTTNLQLTASEVAAPTLAESRLRDCRTARSDKSRMSMRAFRRLAAESRAESLAVVPLGHSGLCRCGRGMPQWRDTRYLPVAWSRRLARPTNCRNSQRERVTAALT